MGGRAVCVATCALLAGLTGCGNLHLRAPKVMDGVDLPTTRDLEADNARYRVIANRRVTRSFPPGSSAAAMKAELLAEGFRPYEMLPPRPPLPHEIVNDQTRLADFNFRHRTLHFGWTTPRAPLPFCARQMNVWWTEDNRDHLLTIGAAVWDNCSK